MNLVQIQERLKDAPVQAIMQYANGMNPMVPPYLALAELKRRESMNQGAQAQQAMQQGKQPSVKEQIEQSAGLAGLQQRMQQQGLQSLMAQQRPEGIPEGVPQPERQPEAEGIQNLPVSNQFNFKEGGIIPFSDGGPTTPFGRMASSVAEKLGDISSSASKSYQESEEKRQLLQAIREELLPLAGITGAFTPQTAEQYERAGQLQRAANPTASAQELRGILAEAKRLKQPGGMPPTRPSTTSPDTSYAQKELARARAVTPPAETQRIGMPMGVPEGAPPPPGARPVGGLPPPGPMGGGLQLPRGGAGAMPQGVPQNIQQGLPSPAGQPMQGGISAIPGSDEAMQMMQESMRGKLTPQQAHERERELAGLYGLKDQYGEERMKRLQQMESARQQDLEGRGMERLMRVLGGISGQGLKGAGTAYLQSVDAERTADAAFRKQMDELMGGVEEKRRAEAVSGMTEAQKQIQEQQKRALESAGKIMDADTRLKLQELQQKAVLGRLSAEEEYIRSELLKGGKYLEIIENLARAKGATRTEADVQKAQLKREAEWNEISGDILRRQEWAKLGVRTLEDYLRYVQRSSGGAGGMPAAGGAQQNRPPLSSFKG